MRQAPFQRYLPRERGLRCFGKPFEALPADLSRYFDTRFAVYARLRVALGFALNGLYKIFPMARAVGLTAVRR